MNNEQDVRIVGGLGQKKKAGSGDASMSGSIKIMGTETGSGARPPQKAIMQSPSSVQSFSRRHTKAFDDVFIFVEVEVKTLR
mmetsp:Transcript_9416/g.19255  ORF Transcript_9416/g.19255 Transcript_9416/m.19255 type:complete len:82 (-) Transcript_9416:886-1131(-)